MSIVSRITEFFTGPATPAVDPIEEQLLYIEQNPSKVPQRELIDHIFMWFNASGDPQYKIQVSNAVKQQVIEAAYSYLDGNGEPYVRNFSLEGLSISDMVMLYRIFDSYQKDENSIGRKVILDHLYLIEMKLKELSKNPETKQEILETIKEAEDGNANVLQFRIFSIPESDKPMPDDIGKDAPLSKLPEDYLIVMFEYLGPTEQGVAKRVCKYWNLVLNNDVFLKASMKRVKATSFFTSARVSRLLSTKMPIPVKITIAYGELTKSLKAHNLIRPNESPLVLDSQHMEINDVTLRERISAAFLARLPLQILPPLENSQVARNLQVLDLSAGVGEWGLGNHAPLSHLPSEIKFFTSLTDLNLSNNSLSELPVEITSLTSLQHFKLSNTQVTYLPDGFSRLVNLTSLLLHDNQLYFLPNDFDSLENLAHLSLQRNRLSSLPENFFRLRKIKAINLSNNALTSLPEGLTSLVKNSDLNWLCFDFSSNQLTSPPENIIDIDNSEKVHFMSFKNNRFSPEDLSKLKKAKKIQF